MCQLVYRTCPVLPDLFICWKNRKMLATATKKRITLLCCILVLLWLIFRYTIGLGNGVMLSIEDITRTPGTPILVTVFYEALCPDSKHFITKQLQPAYQAAPSLIEVVFVPYGKASLNPVDLFSVVSLY